MTSARITTAIEIGFRPAPSRGVPQHKSVAEAKGHQGNSNMQCIRVDADGRQVHVAKGDAAFAHRQFSTFDFDHVGFSPQHSSIFLSVAAPMVFDFIDDATPQEEHVRKRPLAEHANRTLFVYGPRDSDRCDVYHYLAAKVAEAASQQVRIKNSQAAHGDELPDDVMELEFSVVDCFHSWGIADILDANSFVHDVNGQRRLNAARRSCGSKGLPFVTPTRKALACEGSTVRGDTFEVSTALRLREELRILYRQSDLIEHRTSSSAIVTFHARTRYRTSALHLVLLPEADQSTPANRIAQQLAAVSTTLRLLRGAYEAMVSPRRHRYRSQRMHLEVDDTDEDDASVDVDRSIGSATSSQQRVPMRESPVLMFLMQTQEYYHQQLALHHHASWQGTANQDILSSRIASDTSIRLRLNHRADASRQTPRQSPEVSPQRRAAQPALPRQSFRQRHHHDASSQSLGSNFPPLPSVALAAKSLGDVAVVVVVDCCVEHHSHVLSACHFATTASGASGSRFAAHLAGHRLAGAPNPPATDVISGLSTPSNEERVESHGGHPLPSRFLSSTRRPADKEAYESADESSESTSPDEVNTSFEPSAISLRVPSHNTTLHGQLVSSNTSRHSQLDDDHHSPRGGVVARGVGRERRDIATPPRGAVREAVVVLSPCDPRDTAAPLPTALVAPPRVGAPQRVAASSTATTVSSNALLSPPSSRSPVRSASERASQTVPVMVTEKAVQPGRLSSSTEQSVQTDEAAAIGRSAGATRDRPSPTRDHGTQYHPPTSSNDPAQIRPPEVVAAHVDAFDEHDDDLADVVVMAANLSAMSKTCDELPHPATVPPLGGSTASSSKRTAGGSVDVEFDFEVPEIEGIIGDAARASLGAQQIREVVDHAVAPSHGSESGLRSRGTDRRHGQSRSPSPRTPMSTQPESQPSKPLLSELSFPGNVGSHAMLVEKLCEERRKLRAELQEAAVRQRETDVRLQHASLVAEERRLHLAEAQRRLEDLVNQQELGQSELIESHQVQNAFYERELREASAHHEETVKTLQQTIIGLSREKIALEKELATATQSAKQLNAEGIAQATLRNQLQTLQEQIRLLHTSRDSEREVLEKEAHEWRRRFDECNAEVLSLRSALNDRDVAAEMRKAEEALRLEVLLENHARELTQRLHAELVAERKLRLDAEQEAFALRLENRDLESRLIFFEEKVAPEVDLSIKELEDQMHKIHTQRRRFQKTLHDVIVKSSASSPAKRSVTPRLDPSSGSDDIPSPVPAKLFT